MHGVVPRALFIVLHSKHFALFFNHFVEEAFVARHEDLRLVHRHTLSGVGALACHHLRVLLFPLALAVPLLSALLGAGGGTPRVRFVRMQHMCR